jgi:hypothetical protein
VGLVTRVIKPSCSGNVGNATIRYIIACCVQYSKSHIHCIAEHVQVVTHTEYISYFRVFVEGIMELDSDPVRSVKSLDRLISFLAVRSIQPLRPSVASFALICELELVIGFAVLLRLHVKSGAKALLPASYMALLNFTSTLTQKSAMMQCVQAIDVNRKTENYVTGRLVRCADIFIGNIGKRLNVLAMGLKVSESSIMEGEMDRVLVLALVFLVNSGSDGLLPDECANRLYDKLQFRARKALNSQQGIFQPTERVAGALQGICAMRGRHDAIQVLRHLLTARDNEYLYACSWQADRVMLGVSYQTVSRLELFGDYLFAIKPTTKPASFIVAQGAAIAEQQQDALEDDEEDAETGGGADDEQPSYDEELMTEDDGDLLESVARQNAAADIYEDTEEAGRQLNEETFVRGIPAGGHIADEMLVPVFASNDRGCAVCGADYLQDWDAELEGQNWSSDDFGSSGKVGDEEDEAGKRQLMHEQSSEHHNAVAAYTKFQTYCNSQTAALLATINLAVVEVRRSTSSQCAMNEMLRRAVEDALNGVEEVRDDLLTTIKEAVIEHKWNKLDDVIQMAGQLEQQLIRAKQAIAEAASNAERVRLTIV